MIRIAHISDSHITPYVRFLETTFDKMAKKVNDLEPQLVIHSGDVTDHGFLEDYKLAQKKLMQIKPPLVVIPGNHDSRNLGHILYPEYMGKRYTHKEFDGIGVVALDTSVPDINEGRLGRTGQKYLQKNLEKFKDLIKIVVIHHHLIPVPEAGREKNLIDDAGDVLKLVCEKNADMVLMGHRHVPNTIKVENTVFVNAGTLSSVKTRGYHSHSFNLTEMKNKKVKIKEIKLIDGKFEESILGKYKLV